MDVLLVLQSGEENCKVNREREREREKDNFFLFLSSPILGVIQSHLPTRQIVVVMHLNTAKNTLHLNRAGGKRAFLMIKTST